MKRTNTAKESATRRVRRQRAIRVGASAVGLAAALGWVAAAPALAESNERQVHVEGHLLPVEKSLGVYQVTGALVGTYTVRSDRIIQAWTYFGTQIREVEGTALINGCVDQNQNQSCDVGEPSGELGLAFSRVASFDTGTGRLLEGRSTHQVLIGGPFAGGVLTTRDIPVGNGDEILSTYEGDLRVKEAAGSNRVD